MFEWFKKKKSWVRFYSLDSAVAIMHPVIENRLTEREWNSLATTERNRPEQGNQIVLNCPAIKQITNVGYVLKAPADFIIKTGKDVEHMSWETPFLFKRHSDRYTFNGSEYYVSWHSPAQTEPLIPKFHPHADKPTHNVAVKVETPWRVKASDDILLLQIPVSYTNENRFTAAMGILDPRYMHAVSVQLFWHITEGEELIKAGTPLVQYIPISRELLSKGKVEFLVDSATDLDREIEEAYTFANHSRFPKSDSVGNKIRTVTTLFDRFRKLNPRSKI